jgi:glycosyltransferase involved in cell wall biosynthesis
MTLLNDSMMAECAADGMPMTAPVSPSRHGGRVLMITLHFPPSAASGAFRMLGFARHLPYFGWSTAVVASSDNAWEPIDPAMASEIPSSTKLRYVPYPTGRGTKLLQRVLGRTGILEVDAAWALAALEPCRSLIREQRPDVLLTSGPPHSVHLLGTYLKREFGLPHVADFRDPWVISEKPVARRARLRGSIERFVIGRADAIIMNAPGARELIGRAYPAVAQKLAVITNGFDPDLDIPAPPTERVGRVRIIHAGELYAGRDPRPLLRGIRQYEQRTKEPELDLTFLGRTSGSGVDLVAEARAVGCSTPVTIEGQVPYADAKRRMRLADVLLLMDSAGRRTGIPAKLFEYMGAGRPILALAEPDGDTAWALRTSRAPFRIARPNDANAIAEAIASLVGEVPANVEMNVDHEHVFARRALAGQLATLLDGLL